MKKNFISSILMLSSIFALTSCQKKEIEKLNSNSTTASTNGSLSVLTSDILRYYYKGSTNNNIYSGNSTDGSNWISTLISNGATLQSGPAAAFFNGNIYVFHRGRTNNNLYYSYSTNRGDSWSADAALGNNAGTASSPSACTFNGKMFLAYVSASFNSAPGYSNIYYSYSSNGSTWTEAILPFTTYSEPCIYSYGSKIYIAYATSSLASINIISSTDGITWSHASSLNYSSVHYSVAVNPNGKACLVRTDRTGQINVSYSDDLINWSLPSYLLSTSGAIAGSTVRPSITFDNVNNRFVVAYRSNTHNNDNIYYADDRDGVLKERGTANGSTTDAPYLISTN